MVDELRLLLLDYGGWTCDCIKWRAMYRLLNQVLLVFKQIHLAQVCLTLKLLLSLFFLVLGERS